MDGKEEPHVPTGGAGTGLVAETANTTTHEALAEQVEQHAEDSGGVPAEASECPVCMDEIQPTDAAMRCRGTAGVHHYFHQQCMGQWIRAQGRMSATCPICRGPLQFNARNLETFLNSEGADGLHAQDRTFLKNLALKLQGEEDWTELDRHYMGLAAAGTAGCLVGCACASGAGDMAASGGCADGCFDAMIYFPCVPVPGPLERSLIRAGENRDVQASFCLGFVLGAVGRIVIQICA